MQNACTVCKAKAIQAYADRNEWKNFFVIKVVCGPPTKPTAPFLSADGSTLPTEKTKILQRSIKAVQLLTSKNTPGSEAIPAEIYERVGPRHMEHLMELFQEMWHQGEVLQDFKDATIMHPYKQKGNCQICDNHRDISLLNIDGRLFVLILLNCLNNHLERGLLLESQCDSRRHRGATDMIFAARQ
nr:unnamed protein product [Spirometra erinaceieuropaei]